MWLKPNFAWLAILLGLFLLVGADCGGSNELPKDERFDNGSGLLDTPSALSKVKAAFGNVRAAKGDTVTISSSYINALESLPAASTLLVGDEIKVRIHDRPEVHWSRTIRKPSKSLWTQFKELVSLESDETDKEERADGSIKFEADRYTVSISDRDVETISEHTDLGFAVEKAEELIRHRMIMARIALGLDIPFGPTASTMKHLGNTACDSNAVCEVFEWKSDYFGDRLVYRAYLNSSTGGLVKLTEKFLSGEKSYSYLVEDLVTDPPR